MNAYWEHLVDFEFLQELQTDVVPVFEIDLMKLPYAQTRLNERIRVENRMTVEP